MNTLLVCIICAFCGGGCDSVPPTLAYGSVQLYEYADEDEFDELDRLLRDKTRVSFRRIYGMLKEGDAEGVARLVAKALADSISYELKTDKELALQMIAVIILGSTFARVSGNMGGYVSENGFFVSYMILMTLLLGELVMARSVVTDTIGGVTDFMEAFYPMYASSILYATGSATARYSQAVIVLVIYLCQNVILSLLLPLIKGSGIMLLVNSIGREDYFSRLAELMRSIVLWGLKSMFAVITGINVIKCMIAPSMDRISRNGVLQSLGRVSGMASVSSVCSVIISTGEFIKSCMGVTCMIIIIILAVVPMVKLLVIVFTLKCIAALVQPIGDRRYACGVSAMASAVELMLKACGISVMMFVLSIALVGGEVYVG